MSIDSSIDFQRQNPRCRLLVAFVMCLCLPSLGCQDGPLYALKKANPYFTMREWKNDRAFGVTDHERREELQLLASQIGQMTPQKQSFWSKHLGRIMNNDPSPEMRRLAVLAASRVPQSSVMPLIEKGLDDESLKVQMEACTALGRRKEPKAAQLLASTLGTTPELDIKNAAIAALGNHKGPVAIDSLRIALEDQDPATTDLVVSSLRGVTGKNYGSDPKQWIAALDNLSNPAESDPSSNPESNTIRYAQGQTETIQR